LTAKVGRRVTLNRFDAGSARVLTSLPTMVGRLSVRSDPAPDSLSRDIPHLDDFIRELHAFGKVDANVLILRGHTTPRNTTPAIDLPNIASWRTVSVAPTPRLSPLTALTALIGKGCKSRC
jgi:hypothetical protein